MNIDEKWRAETKRVRSNVVAKSQGWRSEIQKELRIAVREFAEQGVPDSASEINKRLTQSSGVMAILPIIQHIDSMCAEHPAYAPQLITLVELICLRAMASRDTELNSLYSYLSDIQGHVASVVQAAMLGLPAPSWLTELAKPASVEMCPV